LTENCDNYSCQSNLCQRSILTYCKLKNFEATMYITHFSPHRRTPRPVVRRGFRALLPTFAIKIVGVRLRLPGLTRSPYVLRCEPRLYLHTYCICFCSSKYDFCSCKDTSVKERYQAKNVVLLHGIKTFLKVLFLLSVISSFHIFCIGFLCGFELFSVFFNASACVQCTV
jgi:hypothetical protein